MAESSHHIFFDPTGRRRKIAIATLCIGAVLLLAGTTIFWLLFQVSPVVIAPPKGSEAQRIAPPLVAQAASQPTQLNREFLQREVARSKQLAAQRESSKGEALRVAFLSRNWESSFVTLKEHREELDAISPPWIQIKERGDALTFVDLNGSSSSRNQELTDEARRGNLLLLPRIVNYSDTGIERRRTATFLQRTKNLQLAAQAVVAEIASKGLGGVIVDFRTQSEFERNQTERFAREIAQRAREIPGTSKPLVGITTLANNPTIATSTVGAVDYVIVVASGERSSLGPIIPLAAVSSALERMRARVSPHKLIVALATEGILKRSASPLAWATFGTALASATSLPTFDSTSGNMRYRGTSATGEKTTGWFVDAAFAYNVKRLALNYGISSIGLWNVGSEDHAVWELLSTDPILEEIEELPPSSPIAFEGRGDGLLVSSTSAAQGERTFTIDPSSNLIASVNYLSVPQVAAIQRYGFKEKAIALTFDDGPAEPYTSQILDILKRERIKATFFVIGEHVLEHPELARRIVAEGHDIGNHSFYHPDLALVSKNRIRLELNATQRAIAKTVDRLTALFRPPYISEGSPLSKSEFRVLAVAQELGYRSVGISNNGRDWITSDRTGADIAREVLEKTELMQGNAILLHDGPDDRGLTVAAVAELIPALRAQGYRFVPVRELLGLSVSQAMPAASHSSWQALYDSALGIITWVPVVVKALLLMVVMLGIFRLVAVIICAVLSLYRESTLAWTTDELEEARSIPVTVLVPAYNEGPVIALTLASLQKTLHRTIEIIVIDDGSRDDTAAIARACAAADPRITVVQQQNGGKSSALNHGIRLAKYDIVVSIDGDTLFAPEAITEMVKYFSNPQVGAVAGNVKVGNRQTVLTAWQSMEYITNIAIGRRAFAFMNGIPVVAGAAGAFRKQALQEIGAYHTDSLAEDMDLTWRMHKAGWRVENAPLAIAYTEAPETWRGLFKQRFRWFYGSLQCCRKHWDMLIRPTGANAAFRFITIPFVLMGSIFDLLAPLSDVKLVGTLAGIAALQLSDHYILAGTAEYFEVMQPLISWGLLYIVFFAIELSISVVAFILDRESMRPLWLLFFQRFIYRQVMYVVAWRAAWRAVSGWKQGWGTLQRTGTVTLGR